MKETAYHEAGHAVVAVRLGCRFEYVTIIADPDEGSAGHLKHLAEDQESRRHQMTTEEWHASLALPEAERMRLFEEEEQRHLDAITVSIAGIAASARWHGDDWETMADELLYDQYDGDYAAVESLYSGLDDEGKERAYQMVSDDWGAVEAVAHALMERKTLTEDEVKELVT